MKRTKKYNVIAFVSIFILAIGLFFGFSNLKVNATGSVNLIDMDNFTGSWTDSYDNSTFYKNTGYNLEQDIDYTLSFNYTINLFTSDLSNYTSGVLSVGTATSPGSYTLYDYKGFDYLFENLSGSVSVNLNFSTFEQNTHYLVIRFFKMDSATNSSISMYISNITLTYTQGDLYRFNSYEEMQDITFGNPSTTAATWGNLYIDNFSGYWDIDYFKPGGTGVLFKMETPSETAGAKKEIILAVDYSYQDPDVILQFRDNNIKLDNIYIYSPGPGIWDFETANNELNTFMQSTNTVWTVVDYWGNFLTDAYPYEMPFYSFGSIVATIICNNNIPGVDPVILTNQNNFESIPDLNSGDYKKSTEQGDDYYMAWGGWYYDGAYTLPVNRTDLVGKQEYNIYGKWTNEWMDGWTIGHKEGSNIDIDDYIKKSDGTSWITAFFGAFSSFFAIKLGSVSLGAIILIPVSISVVWFVIKLFRGGS